MTLHHRKRNYFRKSYFNYRYLQSISLLYLQSFDAYHKELFLRTVQLTGFYMRATLAFNGLILYCWRIAHETFKSRSRVDRSFENCFIKIAVPGALFFCQS